MAQVAEGLPSVHEAVSLNPSTAKKPKTSFPNNSTDPFTRQSPHDLMKS
jgi:hypothetical protein